MVLENQIREHACITLHQMCVFYETGGDCGATMDTTHSEGARWYNEE